MVTHKAEKVLQLLKSFNCMLIFRGLRVSETVKELGQRYQYWLPKPDILRVRGELLQYP